MIKIIHAVPRLFLITAFVFSMAASAEDGRTVCRSNDVKHIVQVVYPQGWDVPCEVRFQTPGEDDRVIWKAETQVGFCERKAQEIIERRINSGWDCTEEIIFDSPALTESSLISDLPPPTR